MRIKKNGNGILDSIDSMEQEDDTKDAQVEDLTANNQEAMIVRIVMLQ